MITGIDYKFEYYLKSFESTHSNCEVVKDINFEIELIPSVIRSR